MAIKSILVLTNAMPSDRATLDLALAAARPTDPTFVRYSCARTCARACSFRRRGRQHHDRAHGCRPRQAERRDLGARPRRVRRLVRNRVPLLDRPNGSGVSAEWRDGVGAPEQVIARFGSIADLIVETGLHERNLPLEQSTIEGSLFNAGRPVLICCRPCPRVRSKPR